MSSLLNSLKNLPGFSFILINHDGIILDYSNEIKNQFGFIDDLVIHKLNIQDFFLTVFFCELLTKTLEFIIELDTKWNNFSSNHLVSIKPIDDTTDFIVFFKKSINPNQIDLQNKKVFMGVKNISNILSLSLNLNATLELILERLKEIITYDCASIMFIDGYNLNIAALNSIDKEYKLPNVINITKESNLSEYIKINKNLSKISANRQYL